jgi:AbiV family abortive infection protein
MSKESSGGGSFDNAIKASLDNAERLLSDAEWLSLESSAPTVYALSILAQEEFAKAFILHLGSLGCIPWDSETRRMLRDHSCKQLFTLILDFLEPELDAFLERVQQRLASLKGEIRNPIFPPHIADAINIIRHEKASKYGGRNDWIDEDDPPCDQTARRVADGYVDKMKQDALYVNIGKAGSVISSPLRITSEIAGVELGKTNRLRGSLYYKDGKVVGPSGSDFEKISETFKVVFNISSFEEYAKNWWA